MACSLDDSKEYSISISTDDPHEAIASVANTLYALVEEELASHDNHEAEECEFEGFARDILGVLARHADQLSAGSVAWSEGGEDDSL